MTGMRKRRHVRRLGAAALLFCALALPAAAKQTAPAAPSARAILTLAEAAQLLRIDAGELESLADQRQVPARRIAGQWRFNRQALLAWVNGDWQLITTAVPRDATRLPPGAMRAISGTGPAAARDPDETPREPASEEKPADQPIGEAPAERTAEEVFLRGQRVLLAPGEATADFGLFYARTDNQQLALVDGAVGLVTVEQQSVTGSLLGRVGVLEETELFASTSFVRQDNGTFLGSRKVADSERMAFGDVRLGVRRTLLREGPGRPDIIATLDTRIPTGASSYAVGGGIAFVKSIDPVILFANANYRHTFSRDFTDIARLEPEDRFDATAGYALALNDTLTLSGSVSGVFTAASEFTHATLRRQDSYSLQFGLTAWLADGLYVEPSVSFGLNSPADSLVFGITVPYSF